MTSTTSTAPYTEADTTQLSPHHEPEAPLPSAGRLAGKRALITGGNSGIGRATAEAFVREGARVVIAGQDRATLDMTANALRASASARGGADGDVIAVAANVTQLADLDRLMDAARDAFGGLDVLFVNAGIGAFVPLAQATPEHFDAVFDVNVKGAFFTVQRALPLLIPGASIILNGSVNGSIGMAGASVYSASKAALRSLARTFSAELQAQMTRVNVISPGPVTTPIYEKQGLPPEVLDAARAHIVTQVPAGRFGDPTEIAAAVVFLASDESRFVVGAELFVDGGMGQL
jgi:NAD(P)-dependent dehydrogenase (short-subunit alcohol dehydrogenase family)